ncbi:hypothetical protein [Mycolicibacterium moriokaense]|uniref:hypothetical protein n=1 Tax=Mycolicibacterium moriokaense TaxID=39691 RepID=UPI001F2192AB|nr:hypothetical protein [Mycolicibacterium moriokaense]
MPPGEPGALTTAGAAGVTKAAVLAWKRAVETAGAATAITVGVAFVVIELVAAASWGRAVTGGAVSATLADTVAPAALVAGELAAKDLPRGEDVEVLASVLLVAGVVFAAPADDDAAVCSGVDVVDERSGAGAVLALLISLLGVDAGVVGLVLLVPLAGAEMSAPPAACTTPARGSVGDPDWVAEFVDVSLADDAATVLAGPVFGEDDPVPLDDEILEEPADVPLAEPVEEEPLESASAIAGLLAVATPSPSATASAPTRPT